MFQEEMYMCYYARAYGRMHKPGIQIKPYRVYILPGDGLTSCKTPGYTLKFIDFSCSTTNTTLTLIDVYIHGIHEQKNY